MPDDNGYVKDSHGGKFSSPLTRSKRKGFLAKLGDKVGNFFSGGDSKPMTGKEKVAALGVATKLAGAGQEQAATSMNESDGMTQGMISGAMAGGMSGMGVPGAVIGGVAGAVQGAAAARAAAKAHNRQVEAKKHQALADIEMKKGEQLSAAIQGMAGRMRIT